MRFTVLLLVLIGLAACGQPESAGPEFRPFSSETGRFSLSAPGEFETREQSVPSEAGDVTLFTYMVNEPGISYLASYVDYPQEAVDALSTEEILDGARDGLIASIGGELVSEEVVMLGSATGREIHYSAQGAQGQGHMLTVLAGRRLYQVGAVGDAEGFPADAVAEFIDSFERW